MIISQVKFVTPEMAKEWLDNFNTNNRNLNIPRAKEFARMIKDGNWRTTHQGIAFYVDGTLADGQHRLKGIVLANIGINIMVTTGLERLDGLAMDNGLSRSISDQFRISGTGKLNNVTIAAIRLLISKGNQLRITPFDVEKFWREHNEIVEYMNDLVSQKHTKGITTASVVSAIGVCAMEVSKEEASRFYKILLDGIPLEPIRNEDFMVIRFRNHLIETGVATKPGISRKETMMKTMRIFKAYIEGKNLTKFYAPEEFTYPIPE